MSAMPSMATESVRRNKPTRCANRVTLRRSNRPLLDHLVGPGEQCWGYGEAERFSCCKINVQLVAIGLLDWKGIRSGSAYNLIDITRCLLCHPDAVRAEADQTS